MPSPQIGDAAEEAPTAAAPCLLALRDAMDSHLQRLGHGGAEPLRWAITAVDRVRGLRVEGVALWTAPQAAGYGEAGELRR